MDEDAIEELVLQWEEAEETAHSVTAEELCRDRPELLPEVSRRLDVLCRMQWLDPGFTADRNAPILAGKFRLDRIVGRGGHGDVWRAFDLILERPVAVKLPHPGALTPDVLTEARRAGGLRHPGIVTVYEVGEADDQAFIVSEYIDGEDLGSRLARGPLPSDDAARIFARIAGALHHAHENGFIHRDVTPNNILLGRDGRVLITDFGLAGPAGPSCGGTPTHMSPEQVRGDPVDRRTDIWALGVVLYEAATGRLPFRATTQSGLLHQILRTDPDSPSRVDPLVPEWLAGVCLRCLAKEPDRRSQTAAEVVAVLQSNLARQPRPSQPWWAVVVGILLVAVAIAGIFAVRPDVKSETRQTDAYSLFVGTDLSAIMGEERDRVLAAQKEVATWAVEKGGTVRLRLPDGAVQTVAWKAGIPDGPFLVVALALADASVGDGDLARMRWLPALESLRLERTRVAGSGMVHLVALPRLRELDLSGAPLTDSGVRGIDLPSSLEGLVLHDTRIVNDYSFVRSARSLRALILSKSSISDQGVKHLAGLTDLRVLDLSLTDITDPALVHLVGMQKLSKLRLDRTWVRGPGLKALHGLPELTELALSQSQLCDEGLSDVSAPPNLKLLQIEDCKVSDEGLRFVKGHQTLEKFGLPGTAIGDEGLKLLLDIPRLKHVNVRKCQVTSAGLRCLAGLADLEELLLPERLITPEDEAFLHQMLSKLKIIR